MCIRDRSYVAYFFPGTVVLVVLFAAIFSTISVIEDRREGFLQAVVVSPVSPFAIAAGKIGGGTLLALAQGGVLVLLSPVLGTAPSVTALAPALLVLGDLSVQGNIKAARSLAEPLRVGMDVDKRLAGVNAVQTLARLNRTYPGKSDTFILDFVNEAEEIHAAFAPYYETAELAGVSDPNIIHDLQRKLDDAQIYTESAVELVARAAVNPKATQAQLDAAADAANALSFIRALPPGWDTNLGERRTRLSAGQRQLLAIARALLSTPPILTLDASTSAIDCSAAAV